MHHTDTNTWASAHTSFIQIFIEHLLHCPAHMELPFSGKGTHRSQKHAETSHSSCPASKDPPILSCPQVLGQLGPLDLLLPQMEPSLVPTPPFWGKPANSDHTISLIKIVQQAGKPLPPRSLLDHGPVKGLLSTTCPTWSGLPALGPLPFLRRRPNSRTVVAPPLPALKRHHYWIQGGQDFLHLDFRDVLREGSWCYSPPPLTGLSPTLFSPSPH